ncbi:hypothetical protein HYU90_03245 [Candidatus Collierbacteria bacterium]|nr:hypothetical protein [Candidatus Collierbacteria bacterium]
MTKYKQYFKEMLSGNQAIFDDFKKIHDQFALDRMKYQDEFNRQGEVVVEIIHDWEKRLCARMEGGKNGVYSANLSEKFKDEIKKVYPKIDLIGVKLSFAA